MASITENRESKILTKPEHLALEAEKTSKMYEDGGDVIRLGINRVNQYMIGVGYLLIAAFMVAAGIALMVASSGVAAHLGLPLIFAGAVLGYSTIRHNFVLPTVYDSTKVEKMAHTQAISATLAPKPLTEIEKLRAELAEVHAERPPAGL